MKWFIADTHFGHGTLTIDTLARGALGVLFGSEEEHDEYLIQSINSTVGRDDHLYILGDFAENPAKWRMRIKCKHIKFVLGNHDPYQKCLNVFGECPERLRVSIYNENRSDHFKAVLDHYPGAFWDGSHRGWCQLYGHTHSQREECLDALFPQRRALDVGIDNIPRVFGRFGPVSEVAVYNYMAKRSGHDDVRFYKDLQAGGHFKNGPKP